MTLVLARAEGGHLEVTPPGVRLVPSAPPTPIPRSPRWPATSGASGDEALARAMEGALAHRTDAASLREAVRDYHVEVSARAYAEVLGVL
jgi:hypothetical protein